MDSDEIMFVLVLDKIFFGFAFYSINLALFFETHEYTTNISPLLICENLNSKKQIIFWVFVIGLMGLCIIVFDHQRITNMGKL